MTPEERVRSKLKCPFCDCGLGCSDQYICEGCYHEQIVAAEQRGAAEERAACAEVAQGQANRDAHATSLAVTSRGQARFYHEHMSAVRIAAAIRARGDS